MSNGHYYAVIMLLYYWVHNLNRPIEYLSTSTQQIESQMLDVYILSSSLHFCSKPRQCWWLSTCRAVTGVELCAECAVMLLLVTPPLLPCRSCVALLLGWAGGGPVAQWPMAHTHHNIETPLSRSRTLTHITHWWGGVQCPVTIVR